MVRKNFWGRAIPDLGEVARDEALTQHLHDGVSRMLGADALAARAAGDLLDLAANARNDNEFETRAHDLLEETGLLRGAKRDLAAEIDYLHDLTAPALVGPTLLDFGCGDGSMARRFQQSGLSVAMADVLEGPKEASLPFLRIRPDGTLPLQSGAFDNVIALSVLHHCQEPAVAVAEMLRVLRPHGVIVLVESVYGVSADQIDPAHPMRATAFGSLTEEQQFCHTMFFDHLVNRVVGSYSADPGQKVNMPYNYNTPQGWDLFLSSLGAVPMQTAHLTVSVGRAPLHHTLHVAQRDARSGEAGCGDRP